MATRVLIVLVALLLPACGGDSDTYTVEQSRAAFETEGYELVEPPPDPSGFALNPWETGEHAVLAPSDGALFRVYVGESAAEEAAAGQGPGLRAYRGNVLVLSTGGIDAAVQQRIRAALEALPGDAEVTIR